MAGAYLFHASQPGISGHMLYQSADCSSADTCLLTLEATKTGVGR